MLEELELRDLGPIHQATLNPAPGMTSITGETGAGKSMLLSALRLISGATADSSRVPKGSQQSWAQGIFLMPEQSDQGIEPILENAGITVEDREVFLSRTVPAQGRSRAVVCGKTVPRSLLTTLCGELITIHGQTDQLRISSPAKQREFLDAVAGNDQLLHEYAQAWEAFREVDTKLVQLTSQEAALRQQADYLRESIERIGRVDPHPSELDELKTRRARIENIERITTGVAGALAALDASQASEDMEYQSASDMIQHAIDVLQTLQFDDELQQCAQRLASVHAEISDIVFILSRQLDAQERGEDLDVLNSRIHELDELVRRWGPTLEDVVAWRDKAQLELEDLDDSPEKLEELQALRKKRYEQAQAIAKRLTQARTSTAKQLHEAVNAELAQLAMAGATLDIIVTTRTGSESLDATGADTIEFLFTPFPGSDALPMGKSASGGELSRLMLALELSAAQLQSHDKQGKIRDSSMTFIFDEVDAGVGGKAAVELGKRLAVLAQRAQVIVVTHLPQVASWAQRQYVVSKLQDEQGETHTLVREVTGKDRIAEIARMLAGSKSRTSLQHARELLETSTIHE